MRCDITPACCPCWARHLFPVHACQVLCLAQTDFTLHFYRASPARNLAQAWSSPRAEPGCALRTLAPRPGRNLYRALPRDYPAGAELQGSATGCQELGGLSQVLLVCTLRYPPSLPLPSLPTSGQAEQEPHALPTLRPKPASWAVLFPEEVSSVNRTAGRLVAGRR